MAVYPLFADWLPSDYLTLQAALKKTGARDIRHSPAVYQLWIRGASYDPLGKGINVCSRMLLYVPGDPLPPAAQKKVFRNGLMGKGTGDGGGIMEIHDFGPGDHEVARFRVPKLQRTSGRIIRSHEAKSPSSGRCC